MWRGVGDYAFGNLRIKRSIFLIIWSLSIKNERRWCRVFGMIFRIRFLLSFVLSFVCFVRNVIGLYLYSKRSLSFGWLAVFG